MMPLSLARAHTHEVLAGVEMLLAEPAKACAVAVHEKDAVARRLLHAVLKTNERTAHLARRAQRTS